MKRLGCMVRITIVRALLFASDVGHSLNAR
jgi:hypothetical protein